MSALHWLKASPDLEVVCLEQAPELSCDLQGRVDQIWRDHGEGFFNGKILSCLSYDAQSVQGVVVPYSWFFAQSHDPTLGLSIRPIAVTAICQCGDRLLLGRRGSGVLQYPDCWEFVPSGGVEAARVVQGRADFRAQVVEELREECGVTTHEKIEVLGLLETEVLDIVCRVTLSSIPPSLLHSDEVTAFAWVEVVNIKNFIQSTPQMVPESRFLAETQFTSR